MPNVESDLQIYACPTITLGVYAHLFGSTDTKAAELVDALFVNASGTASA